MIKIPLRVGIDVDGVLRDFVGAFGERYKDMYGEDCVVEPVTDYAMWKRHYPLNSKEEYTKFFNQMFPHLIFGEANPTYRYVMNELLNVIKYFGKNIHWIITTQQIRENWKYTFDWLYNNGCPINEYRFCNNIEEKLVDLDVLLDDCQENLLIAGEKNIVPIRYKQPWNTELKTGNNEYTISKIIDLKKVLAAWKVL